MRIEMIGTDGLRLGSAFVPAGACCSSCCHCWTFCCTSCAAVGYSGDGCTLLDEHELTGGLVPA